MIDNKKTPKVMHHQIERRMSSHYVNNPDANSHMIMGLQREVGYEIAKQLWKYNKPHAVKITHTVRKERPDYMMNADPSQYELVHLVSVDIELC